VLALAGSDAAPAALVADGPSAFVNALEKVSDAPVALGAVELDDDELDGGVNAVWRLVICESICETRVRMSVMLTVFFGHRLSGSRP
jgi:hypothetical protein